MIPIPAIDIKGGKVVRLLQGQFDAEKIYDDRPAAIARSFETEGAPRIHVVDLDGALGGRAVNLEGVRSVLEAVRVPVEVGGGIRDLKTMEAYFKLGAGWVVVGTKACLDEGFLREAVREFGEKLILGLDARDGFVATDAWTKITDIRAIDFARSAERAGAACVIYTDIFRDGMLSGPSLKQIKALGGAVGMDVIASGGIGSLKDLEDLKGLRLSNLKGAIIGKALYEKKFTLKEALKTCSPKE